jgi:hypothetical protein
VVLAPSKANAPTEPDKRNIPGRVDMTIPFENGHAYCVESSLTSEMDLPAGRRWCHHLMSDKLIL